MGSYVCTCLGGFQHTLSECWACKPLAVQGQMCVCVDTMDGWLCREHQYGAYSDSCKIFLPGEIFDAKLLLSNSICNPEELHLLGVQVLAFYSVVGDDNCGRIITVDRGGMLRMTHFFKCESKFYCLFAI